MPTLRTDDGPRRLRAVWLGPRGVRFPFEWTYVQWALVVCLTVPMASLVLGVLWPIDSQLAVMACVPWGAMGSVMATRWIISKTDFDRPVKYWRWVIKVELHRSRRVPRERAQRVTAPMVGEVALEIRRMLYGGRVRPRRSVGLAEDA